jgi:hypothetical protein
MKPIVLLYNSFINYRNSILYRIQFNSQVIYLEKALNDTFNNGALAWIGIWPSLTPNGIYISEPPLPIKKSIMYSKSDGVNGIILYSNTDNVSPPRTKFIMYGNSDYNNEVDYIINVPIALIDFSASPDRLNDYKAFVNQYNKAGSRYKIVNY